MNVDLTGYKENLVILVGAGYTGTALPGKCMVQAIFAYSNKFA